MQLRNVYVQKSIVKMQCSAMKYRARRCCQKIRATLRRLAGPVRPRPAKRLNDHHSPLGFVICHATAGPRCLGIGQLPEEPC